MPLAGSIRFTASSSTGLLFNDQALIRLCVLTAYEPNVFVWLNCDDNVRVIYSDDLIGWVTTTEKSERNISNSNSNHLNKRDTNLIFLTGGQVYCSP